MTPMNPFELAVYYLGTAAWIVLSGLRDLARLAYAAVTRR